ncbi:MAG: peptide deformylase [Phycisphaerales bacterium]|nr:peptide deformylase [Phycisphaerales bacterium]
MNVDPGSLRIRFYPERILRQKAGPIDLTPNVAEVALQMVNLMRQAEGIGLAAPQVGLPWRLFVIDIPPGEGRDTLADPPTATEGPLVFVNPELSDPARNLEPLEEGCLSLPEIRGDVIRPTQVTVTATGLDGQRFTLRAAGLLARCIQHEYDHLDGVLILDRMIQVHRMQVEPLVRALERRGGVR